MFVIRNIGQKDSGNALLYVFMAIGLLAALTYSFVKGSRENYNVQNSARIAEEMYVQVNLMKSSIMQCRMEYIEGGGDLDGDGLTDESDNYNTAFPLEPTNPLHDNAPACCATNGGASGCISSAVSDDVRNLKCIGAPIREANMFTGQNNSGAFLPPKPQGFEEWTYKNDANGVYLQIISTRENMSYESTLTRLLNKFATCQADIDYNNCGENCLTVWVKRNSCP